MFPLKETKGKFNEKRPAMSHGQCFGRLNLRANGATKFKSGNINPTEGFSEFGALYAYFLILQLLRLSCPHTLGSWADVTLIIPVGRK